MTESNQDAAGAPATNESPTPSTPATTDGPADLHVLQNEINALNTELAKHEAADTAAQTSKQVPSLGRIVIVREAGKNDAPGIIAEVLEDTISCNVFRGDHIPHVATHLTPIDAQSGGAGWFWPPRV